MSPLNIFLNTSSRETSLEENYIPLVLNSMHFAITLTATVANRHTNYKQVVSIIQSPKYNENYKHKIPSPDITPDVVLEKSHNSNARDGTETGKYLSMK
jgi:hypothetical protein